MSVVNEEEIEVALVFFSLLAYADEGYILNTDRYSEIFCLKTLYFRWNHEMKLFPNDKSLQDDL